MTILAIALTVLTCLACLVWTSRHVMIWREKRSGFILTEDYPGLEQDPPMISVLVAAKDEAANIEACVRTMLQQDYPNFEMIVCNDRSADDTPAIVERIAREDPRLRLVSIEQLPEGWCGKNNAMQTGIAASSGEWICMTDADCRQISRRTLSVAMRYALDTRADMLSVLPVLEMRGFWENVVQPVCSGLMMVWFHPDSVNDPTKPHAYANGAFILMRRSAYEAIGTHEAVKDRVNEDMHMAARVKRAGLNLRVVRGGGLYKVRMYTSLRQILHGWGRIFYGTFCTLRRLTLSLVVLIVMGLLPYAAAGLGLALAAAEPAGGAWWLACGIAGVAAAAMQISVIFRFYRLIAAKPALAWSYPLGSIITMICLFIGMSKLRRGAGITWRGTRYPRPQRQ
jgi:cellulose synthase/poly-beta-1,6-N-acetylglucosamine synthase-like glycosyltransferase